MKSTVDFAALGYPAVRDTFNETLQLCAQKLTNAEIRLAQDILDLTDLHEEEGRALEMLMDTALYSRKGKPGKRTSKRAIDKIAEKLLRVHDPVKSAIAARLPTAIYSIFGIAAGEEPDLVLAQDLLDERHAIRIMDHALAAQVAKQGEMLIAGRFCDLGPWHIGFGIVQSLRKSEALAVSLMMTGQDEDNAAERGDLHEFLYAADLHDEDIVMTAMEPVIRAFAMAIDADLIDVDDVTASFGSIFSGGADDEDKLKTIAP